MNVHVIDHPLAQHMLAELRNVHTTPQQFRHLAHVLSTILILEATREVPVTFTEVQTPLTTAKVAKLNQGLAVVPVLRAGLAMLEATLALFPDVAVGYIGLERNEKTGVAQSYYCNLPNLKDRYILCMDPMLATGGSASQALSVLEENGAQHVTMVSVLAAPEGIERLQQKHPQVPLYVGHIDERLDENRFIVPGLGDFGDRMYGTL